MLGHSMAYLLITYYIQSIIINQSMLCITYSYMIGTGPACIENKGICGQSSHHSDELSLISSTLSLID